MHHPLRGIHHAGVSVQIARLVLYQRFQFHDTRPQTGCYDQDTRRPAPCDMIIVRVCLLRGGGPERMEFAKLPRQRLRYGLFKIFPESPHALR